MKDSLTIKKLAIRNTAGFHLGSLPEMDLSPALNIIYGPNASGKSTTARIIHALLWPKDLSNHDTYATAEVQLPQATCQLTLIAKNREESPAGIFPYLGEANNSPRYMLAQHELIAADEKGEKFVKIIINEAHGNIDLSAIANQFGYSQLPRTINIKNFTDKYALVKAAKKNEAVTSADEDKLKQLNEEIAAAQAAKIEAQQLQLLQEFRTLQESVDDLQAKFAAFPPQLANLLNDDDNSITQLSDDITNLQHKRAQEEEIQAKLELALTELNITDPQQLAQDIKALRIIEEELQSLETHLHNEEQAAARARQVSERKLANVGGTSPLAPDTNLPAQTIAKLESLAQKSATNLAQLTGLTEQLTWLSSTVPATPTYTTDKINEALKCLRQWLLAPEKFASLPQSQLIGVICAGIAALLSIIIALQQQAVLAWFAVSASLMAVLAFVLRKKVSVETKASWEQKYQQLAVSSLQSWDEQSVQQEIAKLQQELNNIIYRQNATNKQRELQQKKSEFSQAAEEIAQERNSFLLEYGLTLPDYVVKGENTLLYYIKDIIDWQKSSEELAIADEDITRVTTLLTTKVATANKILTDYQCAEISSSIELRDITDTLNDKLGEFRTTTTKINSSKQQIQQLTTRWDEKVNSRSQIIKRLDLGIDIPQVRILLAQLLPQLDDYNNAKRQLTEEQAVLKAKKSAVDAIPIINELTPLSDVELQNKLAECQHQASQSSDLNTKKGECQQRIANAKATNDCERLTAELETEYETLQKKLLINAHSVTGNELVNMLKREVVASSTPAVMKRACELFANFTTGRYELRISEDQQQFTAYDSQDQVVLHLDQLSSGTRVQLLIAVRVAFVEIQEQSLQLPLLLDEALASSDPVREEAIINTALTLASGGRQIFYFTNKPEEAQLWEQHARENNIEFARINLPGKVTSRNLQRQATAAIADGANLTHEEYGLLLKVPTLSYQLGLLNAHIWYVIEDNKQLKILLENNINSCAQLANPDFALVIDSLIGAEAGQRARLLTGLLTKMEPYWKQGHPKPFTPLALDESDARRSENFRNSITALAEEVEWDINEILNRLYSKEVSRFTASHTDRLKEYCLENGYYCDIEPLENIELHRQLLSDAQFAIADNEITTDEVNRLAKRILN